MKDDQVGPIATGLEQEMFTYTWIASGFVLSAELARKRVKIFVKAYGHFPTIFESLTDIDFLSEV